MEGALFDGIRPFYENPSNEQDLRDTAFPKAREV